ncbi:hypothetical protein EHM92_00360 [bacterium]|nr:MAG: hypothetical protein EHM92_00360 [bacterium]
MHRFAGTVAPFLVIVAVSNIGLSQTTVNPDISVIPRFLIESNDGEKFSQGKREFSQPDFQFQELELAIQSYLNPFSRADVILTLPGPDIEAGKLGIEELYATVFRGLPLDLNLRFGKYRVEYGKINVAHPHAWPFITQPLSQARFLGEEGLNDLGISASILLPTGDVYSKLTVDLLRGGAIGETAGISDTSGSKPFYANSARLMSFFTLTDESDLEVGLSTLTGIHDPYNRDRFWYLNADFKYKYKPSMYTSLVLQGEYLYNTRSASQDQPLVPFLNAAGGPETRTINSSGLYIYADYQFFKLYSIGARYDWSEAPYSKDDKASGVSVFAGYYPVEETLGLRLEYQHLKTETPVAATAVNTIVLQVLFSLGPHKAHPF